MAIPCNFVSVYAAEGDIYLSGSNVVVEGNAGVNLSAGWWGFVYSIGNGVPTVWSRYEVGLASDPQTTTWPLSDLDAGSGDILNIQAGYCTADPFTILTLVGSEFHLSVP